MTSVNEDEDLPLPVPRRTALALGLGALAGIAAGFQARAEGNGSLKVTVLYGAPKDPAAFETYYLEKHMPLVYAVKEIKRAEISMGLPSHDGKPPAFYRIAEIWFDNPEHMKQVTSMPEWKTIVDDVPNFASGGATVVISKIG